MVGDLRTRYETAEKLLPHRLKDLIYSSQIQATWVEGAEQFWYVNATRDGTRFLLVDAASGRRGALFDHELVAASLSEVLGRSVEANNLPIRGLVMRLGEPLQLRVEGQTWLWDSSTSTITSSAIPAPTPLESVSPDGRWAVVIRDDNLVVRERASGDERALTRDGIEGFGYGTQPDMSAFRFTLEPLGLQMPPAVLWSPDSRRLVTSRIDQRELELLHYVQSAPPDGSRPRLYSDHYPLVGDEHVLTAELVVVDVETGTISRPDNNPFALGFVAPVTARQVWWTTDSACVYFIAPERAERTVRLYAYEPDTNRTNVLVEESHGTHVQTHPTWPIGSTVRHLRSGETIWWSERSGWGHLYCYATDGSVRPLTAGEWIVRELVAVDEDARHIVFSASGREPGLDPYVRQLYRVGLDDGELKRLTNDSLDHETTGSPSGRFLIDVRSSVDSPQESHVLDSFGRATLALERADVELLYEAGWTAPERFTVTAADGVTDLYGLLYKPSDFDPNRRYPVLDDIYPGPQINAASVSFCDRQLSPHAASMAALGFAVMVLDARGTPLRSKAFQDHCRNERDDYFDDHVAALKQLAETRRWLDLERVGIYGRSGGGYAATAAVLRRPDFFQVAVSVAGCHDDELYHAGWGEKYVGKLGEADYHAHANSTFADRLRGKLLLIHGELDNNVNPAMTLRLVDALMSANKDFDLLIVPNADHTMVVHQSYWLRRLWDYFVQHLQGVQPPTYKIAEFPIALAVQRLLG